MHSIHLTDEELDTLKYLITERLASYKGDESIVIASIHEKLEEIDTDNFYNATDY